MDMSQYRDLFVSESGEHLRSLADLVVGLEKAGADAEKVNALFRHAHSVKGMAAAMQYDSITRLAHVMENLLDRVRKGQVELGPAGGDLLLEGVDLLETMVSDVSSGGSGELDTESLTARLDAYRGDLAAAMQEAPPPAEPPPSPAAGEPPEQRTARPTVRVRTDLLDRLVTLTGELLTTRHHIAALAVEEGMGRMKEPVHSLSRLLRELHDTVLTVRMMPFSVVTDTLPRVVRDLARREGKSIDLTVRGNDIELDRRVLEELGDPLVHMIRNAVDHGIERPEERVLTGKPLAGRIAVSAAREGDDIVVTVSDDGRGIDAVNMLNAAVQQGFVTPEAAAAMSGQEALLLSCLPGFSTASKVTDISGRGVGMDAVQSRMKEFGGYLGIESVPGEGTTIRLRFPRSIAIVNVLLLSAGGVTAAVPAARIEKMMELQPGKTLAGDDIRLVSLARLLGGAEPGGNRYRPVLVTEVRGRRTGLVADAVIGQQDLFVKPLGRPLSAVRGLAGAGVLGEGNPVFVLDVANLPSALPSPPLPG